MPYPEMMVAPMREDLTRIGFRELRDADAVDELLGNEKRSTLLFVNSVCGCAAGGARPGAFLSLQEGARPEVLATVFAGQDLDATEKAREYIVGYPASSPAIALFKEGQLAWMMERHEIEGRTPYEIAASLKAAFEEHCG